MRSRAAGTEGQVGHRMVNGSEGAALSWDAVDWQHHEDNVRRVRQRIFTATRSGNLAMVRTLQKITA
ncbi:reverse transcriptase N-terminal domain-containing protein [Nocardia gamkensis]|uniref:reverse transcriptase N-terminal domain-containing protein n=1 Tax=Nocardia gamkensis TaxID=352869 RepID=UPI0037C7D4C2